MSTGRKPFPQETLDASSTTQLETFKQNTKVLKRILNIDYKIIIIVIDGQNDIK